MSSYIESYLYQSNSIIFSYKARTDYAKCVGIVLGCESLQFCKFFFFFRSVCLSLRYILITWSRILKNVIDIVSSRYYIFYKIESFSVDMPHIFALTEFLLWHHYLLNCFSKLVSSKLYELCFIWIHLCLPVVYQQGSSLDVIQYRKLVS